MAEERSSTAGNGRRNHPPRRRRPPQQRGTAAAAGAEGRPTSTIGMLGSTLASIGTTALAAYGVYQFATLAYQAWNNDEDEEDRLRAEEERRRVNPFSIPMTSVPDPLQHPEQQKPQQHSSSSPLWESLWQWPEEQPERNCNRHGCSNSRRRYPPSQEETGGTVRNRRERRKRQQEHIRQCRAQVRHVLDRLVPTTLKRSILQVTDFQPERQALQQLRKQQQQQQQQQQQLHRNPQPTKDNPCSPNGTNGKSDSDHNDPQQEDEEEEEETHQHSPTNDDQYYYKEEQEQRLWKTIIQQSMTRLVLTIYAPSLLFVVLTVQVSVLLSSNPFISSSSSSSPPSPSLHASARHNQDETGGHLEEEDDDDVDEDDDNIQQWVLEQTYHYMFQHGIPSLMNKVQRVVRDILSEQHVLQGWCEVGNPKTTTTTNFNQEPSSRYHRPNDDARHDIRNGTPTTTKDGEMALLLQAVTPRQLSNILQQVEDRLRQDSTCQRQRSLLRFVQPPSAVAGSDDGDDYDDDESSSDDERDTEEVEQNDPGKWEPNGGKPTDSDGPSRRRDGITEQRHCRRRRRQRHRRIELLDTIWDMLESPMVEDALQDSLRVMQTLLFQDLYQPRPQNGETAEHLTTTTTSTNNHKVPSALPMTQLLTNIKSSCQTFFAAFAAATEPEHGPKNGQEQGIHNNDNNNNINGHSHQESTIRRRRNHYLQALEQSPPILEAMDYFFPT